MGHKRNAQRISVGKAEGKTPLDKVAESRICTALPSWPRLAFVVKDDSEEQLQLRGLSSPEYKQH